MILLDIEAALVTWLTAQLPGTRVCTETPATLTPPTVRVTRVGGPDIVPGLERATVAVDCFGDTRPSAKDLAAAVRDKLTTNLPVASLTDGTRNGSALAVTISGPGWAPWDDTNVRRFTAAYDITVHTH